MRKGLAIITILILMIAAGCGNQEQLNEDKVNVLTSFYPLYDMVSQIGGEHVHAINMIPAGVDPHDWTYKSQDIVQMTKAQLFIYNGAGFDDWWVDEMLHSLGNDQPPIVVASEGISLIEADANHEDEAEHAHDEAEHAHDEAEHAHDEAQHAHDEAEHSHDEAEHERDEEEHAHDEEEHAHDEEEHAHDEAEHAHGDGHHHGNVDPHVWLSPVNAIQLASNIKEGLISVDPEHEADYEANYEVLKGKLERLHEEYETVVREAPRREFVTSHQAFAYLARDYGLTQLSVMGLTTEAEPTSQDMKTISKFIEEHGVRYMLFEELASPEIAKTLAKDLGIQMLPFHPIEGLTKQQEADGKDYLSLMRENLNSLKLALQG